MIYLSNCSTMPNSNSSKIAVPLKKCVRIRGLLNQEIPLKKMFHVVRSEEYIV
jgi:hypothetical protein